MENFKNPLIVALDVDTLEEADRLAGILGPYVGAFKVGMQLFYSNGIEAVQRVKKNGPVFLDLKMHDIPNTVAGAARALTRLGVSIINVHAAGGRAMMQAAAEAVRDEAARINVPQPLVIAVTVLTSMDQEAFNRDLSIPGSIQDRVAYWAAMAKEAGLDGVVASPREISAIRDRCGLEFAIITPGVRPEWSAANDQKRTMTPAEAVRLGATCLVIGRPVTVAANPVDAIISILNEISV